jgi:protein-S-isoprenylcysteine O-methyltransferase Ste14
MDSSEDRAAVRIFPPAVPVATVLAGLALQSLWPIGTVSGLSSSVRYAAGGLIVIAAVLGLGLWSVLLVRRSSQSENPWKPTTAIIEQGPFRISRNPMYLQMVLVCLGFSLLLWNAWILMLTPVCAWLLQRFAIEPEERYLELKFGEQYRSYQRRVRRWI